MRRSIRIILHLLLVISFLSCNKDECHDMNYGELYLEPVSHTYEIGANTNAIIFKDSAGVDHRFELSMEIDDLRTSFRSDTCDGQAFLIEYHNEYFLRRYSDQSNTAIAYAQIVDFL